MSFFVRRKESDILNLLIDYFKEKYICQRHSLAKIGNSFFEFDLVCESKIGPKNKIIIEVKNSNRIFDYTISDYAFFTGRYSSRHANERIRFYLCVEASATIKLSARQLLESSGIGIIKVKNNLVETIEEPESLRKKIDEFFSTSFNSSEENLASQLSEQAEYLTNLKKQMKLEMARFFAPIKLKPPYKPRISGELIDKLDNLSRVAYSNLLKEFRGKYEIIENATDENNLILKTLGKLWEGKYGKTQGAKAFNSFEKFEPILKDIPGYRDHMVHPFQVFLMGCLIVDANYDFFVSAHKNLFKESKEDTFEFAWLLCSTFHDVCYPIQKYEEFSKNFFLDFLHSDASPIVFQAEKLLMENDNLKYIDQLVALFEHYSKGGTDWKFDSLCRIDQKIRSQMIGEISNKNHALLSSIALIKKILAEFAGLNWSAYKEGRFSTDVYPAALAIALHDEMFNKIDSNISLESMPLCFLLIYCDLVQECGRSEGEEVVELHSFTCEKDAIETTLSFTKEDSFKLKTAEMERIYKKLHSPSIHYKLNLRYSGSTRAEDTIKDLRANR